MRAALYTALLMLALFGGALAYQTRIMVKDNTNTLLGYIAPGVYYKIDSNADPTYHTRVEVTEGVPNSNIGKITLLEINS